MISSYPHLADLDADEIADPPPLAESNLSDDIRAVDDSSLGSSLLAEKIPDYFKIATLDGITEDDVIHVSIAAEHVATSIGGDACSTNVKASRLTENEYGFVFLLQMFCAYWLCSTSSNGNIKECSRVCYLLLQYP